MLVLDAREVEAPSYNNSRGVFIRKKTRQANVSGADLNVLVREIKQQNKFEQFLFKGYAQAYCGGTMFMLRKGQGRD